MKIFLLMLGWLPLALLAGCGRPRPTEGTFSSAIGSYAFRLTVQGEAYDYYQADNAEFPHFRGRCFLLERNAEFEKLLGVTGMTNPPVIFLRVRRVRDLVRPGVEISADDKTWFDNGWLWLKANPAMDVSPDHGKQP